MSALGIAAVLLAAGGVVFASTAPDGIEQLAMQAGLRKPLAGYGGGAGVAGVALLYLVCLGAGRVVRKRSEHVSEGPCAMRSSRNGAAAPVPCTV